MNSFEVTSYEGTLLLDIKGLCPGIATDLLYPRSEPWMNLDVVAYRAANLARLAGVRAVHLHPSHLSGEVIGFVRSYGIQIHSWDVNAEHASQAIVEYNIPRFCTDQFELAASFSNCIIV